jgi:RNA polymerase sigma factor (sigma-70 family)
MSGQETCWTLIDAAAAGSESQRAEFVRLYQPVAASYFQSRWGASPLRSDIDDAVQDLFIECFRSEGVLDRVARDRPEGFRRFFHGVLRNVALRRETKRQPEAAQLAEHPDEQTRCSQAFDRAWAHLVLAEATRLQAAAAALDGERAQRRVELLRLRFQEGMPIRDIAQLWQEDPVHLHREYATARNEFSAALREALAFQNPGASPEQLNTTFREFLQLLG